MVKTFIIDSLNERNRMLSSSYIPREGLDEAKKGLTSNLVKVILGPRRAGKSVFALEMLRGENFAYLNFEDENLLKVVNYDEIIAAILEVYDNPKYLLFDEIQNLPNWEMWVNKLHRRGFNLILTGSNANLLSGELATSLTGRHIPINIYPFSFKEYARANKLTDSLIKDLGTEEKGRLLNALDDYLKSGGFPEIVVNKLDPVPYLRTLIESTLFKDVVKRYKIKNTQLITDLTGYCLSNVSTLLSPNGLRKILNFKSLLTTQRYLKYLQEVYLVTSLNRFSYKIREQYHAPSKIYTVDNGLARTGFSFSGDYGKLLENMVFNYYRRQGFKPNLDIFYYQTKSAKEVDFVIKKGYKINTLVQVCYNPESFETQKRELSALVSASEELSCNNLFVITWDTQKEVIFKDRKIIFQPYLSMTTTN